MVSGPISYFAEGSIVSYEPVFRGRGKGKGSFHDASGDDTVNVVDASVQSRGKGNAAKPKAT